MVKQPIQLAVVTVKADKMSCWLAKVVWADDWTSTCYVKYVK